MLRPTQWEHVQLNWIYGRFNKRRRERHFNNFKEELDQFANKPYLSGEEKQSLAGFTNKATQILGKQTQSVQLLYEKNMINPIQQADLQAMLNGFYEEQGEGRAH